MKTTQRITIDLIRKDVAPVACAMQNDANSRVVEISLMENGAQWPIPAGASANLSYRKPDGTRGFYSETEEGVSAIQTDGNTASVILAGQVLTVAGTVDAALVLNNVDGQRIASLPFQIHVSADPAAGKVRSDDYFTPGNAVLFTPQSLSAVQRLQARSNIGAASAASVVEDVLMRLDGKPEAWLYGPDKHRLPALPYWDRTVYPYACIAMRNGEYAFFVDQYRYIMSKESGLVYVTYTDYTFLLQDGQWKRYNTGGYNWIPIWANHPIYYADSVGGALFLEESDPEPVYSIGGGSQAAAFPEVAVTALGSLGGENGMLTFSEEDNAKLDAATQTPGPICLAVTAGDEAGGFTFRALMNHTTDQMGGSTRNAYSTLAFLLDMPLLLALTKLEGTGWVMGMVPLMG